MTRNRAHDLGRVRAGIDAVDDGIVALLARRRRLVLRLARIKKQSGIPIYDRRREQALARRVKKWGGARGLSREFVGAVFRLIVTNSKEMQRHEVG